MDSIPQPSIKNSLVQCSISPRIEVSVFADMVTVKRYGERLTPIRQPAKRGAIKKFSQKSRKRMIDTLARKRDYSRPIFLTFTYPDEVWFDRKLDGRALHDHLDALIKRFARFAPEMGLIWRIEIEDRKSGRFEGEFAPHIHIIVDGLNHDLKDLRKEFRRWWYEIITSGQCNLPKRPRIDVQAAKSRRHAMYYISKYVAKTDDNSASSNSQELDAVIPNIGRFWGVCGMWDRSPVLVTHLTHAQYVSFRRAVSRWLKSRGSRFASRLARSNIMLGCSAYGLGDLSNELYESVFDSAIMRLLWFVICEERKTPVC